MISSMLECRKNVIIQKAVLLRKLKIFCNYTVLYLYTISTRAKRRTLLYPQKVKKNYKEK